MKKDFKLDDCIENYSRMVLSSAVSEKDIQYCEEAKNEMRMISKYFLPSIEKYIDILLSKDLAKNKTEEHLQFVKRFAGSDWIHHVEKDETYRALIECLLFGLFSHLFLIKHENRNDYTRLPKQIIDDEFILQSLMSEDVVKNVLPKNSELCLGIFELYTTQVLKNYFKKTLGLGVFKQGRARGFFKNIFFTGMLMGVTFDTKET